jgi:hypothetical protein
VQVNIKLNWLPTQLTDNSCRLCNNVLQVQVTQGNPAVSITASYIKGTTYTFIVTFDFMNGGPLTQFSASVIVNPQLQTAYFSGVDTSQVLTIQVDPATLAQKSNANAAQ